MSQVISYPILTALSRESLAELLSRAGGQEITQQDIAAQIERGAPKNQDGTIHFIQYMAWLVRQVN